MSETLTPDDIKETLKTVADLGRNHMRLTIGRCGSGGRVEPRSNLRLPRRRGPKRTTSPKTMKEPSISMFADSVRQSR